MILIKKMKFSKRTFKFPAKLIPQLDPDLQKMFEISGQKAMFTSKAWFIIRKEGQYPGHIAVWQFGKEKYLNLNNNKRDKPHITVHSLTADSHGVVHMHHFKKWKIHENKIAKIARNFAAKLNYDLDSPF